VSMAKPYNNPVEAEEATEAASNLRPLLPAGMRCRLILDMKNASMRI